jgi:predicted Rdx family selenoprotein
VKELGVDASIEPGARAEFTVWSDGELVFSKATEDRFPEPGEIASRLAA